MASLNGAWQAVKSAPGKVWDATKSSAGAIKDVVVKHPGKSAAVAGGVAVLATGAAILHRRSERHKQEAMAAEMATANSALPHQGPEQGHGHGVA